MSETMNSAHRSAIELLPWYVNGTLGADEAAALERHLGECLTCRHALREVQRTQALVREQDDVPLSVEHGLNDLLSTIDARGTRRSPAWLRPALAVAVAGLLAAAALFVFRPQVQPENPAAPFSTLTDAQNVAGTQIDIVFADGIAPEQIAAIIAELGARLLEGPSEIGRYTIVIDDASAVSVQALIERLSADERIRFAGQSFIAVPGERPPPGDSQEQNSQEEN